MSELYIAAVLVEYRSSDMARMCVQLIIFYLIGGYDEILKAFSQLKEMVIVSVRYGHLSLSRSLSLSLQY